MVVLGITYNVSDWTANTLTSSEIVKEINIERGVRRVVADAVKSVLEVGLC